jgi:hypothetical protein
LLKGWFLWKKSNEKLTEDSAGIQINK